MSFDLVAYIERQRCFSAVTWGPGPRERRICNHIRKELLEIETDPTDLEEWIDVISLAIDGAWRAGHEPAEICRILAAKMTKNEGRNWPDWRTLPDDQPMEHLK